MRDSLSWFDGDDWNIDGESSMSDMHAQISCVRAYASAGILAFCHFGAGGSLSSIIRDLTKNQNTTALIMTSSSGMWFRGRAGNRGH